MIHRMPEYNRLISKLRTVRYDLAEKVIVREIEKIASRFSMSTIVVLEACISLAIHGYPMPWEKESENGK